MHVHRYWERPMMACGTAGNAIGNGNVVLARIEDFVAMETPNGTLATVTKSAWRSAVG